MHKKNIGFISTRFSGTDGVTLEASKWAEIFERCGHHCYWFAGELDRDTHTSLLVAEAHFQYPSNIWINERILGCKGRETLVTDEIHALKSILKIQIRKFIQQFSIDLLIAENVITIPMHVPLGIGLTEILAETQIPTIAHHHDFYWERTRFSVNAVGDFLRMAFPPHLPNIKHVVINSAAQEELALRTGISSTIIPNVLDFKNPPNIHKKHNKDFRESIGLTADDIIILQPTRIVQRKGIEHAIALVQDLKDPRCKLVISHEAGDEGYEYAEWLQENASEHGVDLRLVTTRISDPMNTCNNHKNRYSLWDVYPHANFITYPSLYEGFGNAFLEAIYFKKPLLINRYATFVKDIEPKDFDLIVMDGFLTKKNIQHVKNILESPARRDKMVNRNYEIASRHYSYAVLRKNLHDIMINFFGM